MSAAIDYRKLSSLGDRVKTGTATKQEKDEFMEMLYKNGSITENQYQDYKTNQNIEELLKAGLAIGAVILIGHLLAEVFSSK